VHLDQVLLAGQSMPVPQQHQDLDAAEGAEGDGLPSRCRDERHAAHVYCRSLRCWHSSLHLMLVRALVAAWAGQRGWLAGGAPAVAVTASSRELRIRVSSPGVSRMAAPASRLPAAASATQPNGAAGNGAKVR
jgi:hypothetical protein